MKRLMNRHPDVVGRYLLGAIPFVLVLILYFVASEARLSENPNDKLLPSFQSMGDAIYAMAMEPSARSGEYLFWNDTWASLRRLALGVGFAALIGLMFGVLNGVIPLARAKLSPFITAISLVPPLAVLPILFIVFGLDEFSKVTLIAIGITPFIIRDLQAKVLELPAEQLIKAQTLGASTWLVIIRVVLPQILPRLIEAMRLSLGAAWLFLIAAEAIASTEGLGYRIFLVRRYLSMEVILPYVLWITILAYLSDYVLRLSSKKSFPWFHATGK